MPECPLLQKLRCNCRRRTKSDSNTDDQAQGLQWAVCSDGLGFRVWGLGTCCTEIHLFLMGGRWHPILPFGFSHRKIRSPKHSAARKGLGISRMWRGGRLPWKRNGGFGEGLLCYNFGHLFWGLYNLKKRCWGILYYQTIVIVI